MLIKAGVKCESVFPFYYIVDKYHVTDATCAYFSIEELEFIARAVNDLDQVQKLIKRALDETKEGVRSAIDS